MPGGADQLVHRQDQGFAAFEREALLADVLGVQVALQDLVALGPLERIEVRPMGPDVAVGGNQLLDRRALATHFRVGAGQHHLGATLAGAVGKGVDDRQVRYIAGIGAIDGRDMLQRVEVLAPRIGHASGIGQVVFVHLFDVGRVAPEEIGIAAIGGVDGLRLTHASLTSVSLKETVSG
jgi:hypothetical protein